MKKLLFAMIVTVMFGCTSTSEKIQMKVAQDQSMTVRNQWYDCMSRCGRKFAKLYPKIAYSACNCACVETVIIKMTAAPESIKRKSINLHQTLCYAPLEKAKCSNARVTVK